MLLQTISLTLKVYLCCAAVIFLSLPFLSYGQTISDQQREPEWVFRNESDSAANFYLVLRPMAEPKGLLVILPGFGGFPSRTLDETELPAKAQRDGYLVVIPFLAPRTFYTDSISQHRLTTLIPEVLAKYNVPRRRFIIGGHSAGGNGALLYAEHAYMSNQSDMIKPDLIFGVDPPLDMKKLWESFEYIKSINFSDVAVNEANFIMRKFETELGGTPSQKPAEYENISSFSRGAGDGGKLKYLKDVPIRLYCDPDIQWYIENRRMPYEFLNAADLSACIVQLRLLGNDDAELVTNIGKGYFPDGRRHPHAFSQLDADEFLHWANAQFGR